MTRGDAAVERAAARLEAWSRHEDAEFVRKLKPSLVRRRLRESPPGDDGGGRNGDGDLRSRLEAERTEARELLAQMRPQAVAGRLPRPNPLLVVLGAFALGVALARLAAARAHAHPL